MADAQENGTCATIMPLHNTNLEDLSLETLDSRIQGAGELKIEHLDLTEAESDLLDKALVNTILSIVVRHGGDSFSKWIDEVKAEQPRSPDTIAVHQTPIHPLPSMKNLALPLIPNQNM